LFCRANAKREARGVTFVCTYCGESVAESLAYRRVSGWERKALGASRKGGSDIVLREAHDEFACAACIARLKAGINVEQGALL
jgi:predicted RNA-binding Zn-ribbon protein involved in translation (DUF1610 family)